MSVLKPRNRLVYFRISEEEFQKVARMCQAEGARSLSDFARSAMHRRLQADGGETGDTALAAKLKLIDQIICDLNQKLEQLNVLLQFHNGAHSSLPVENGNGFQGSKS
jgi:hypothetical protein